MINDAESVRGDKWHMKPYDFTRVYAIEWRPDEPQALQVLSYTSLDERMVDTHGHSFGYDGKIPKRRIDNAGPVFYVWRRDLTASQRVHTRTRSNYSEIIDVLIFVPHFRTRTNLAPRRIDWINQNRAETEKLLCVVKWLMAASACLDRSIVRERDTVAGGFPPSGSYEWARGSRYSS